MNTRRAVSLLLGLSFLLALPLFAAGEQVVPTRSREARRQEGLRPGPGRGRRRVAGRRHVPHFGKAYPNQTFSAVIPKELKAKFPNPSKWQGKTVTVTGR